MAFFRQPTKLLASPERQLSGPHEREFGAQATISTMIANPTLGRIFVLAPGLAIPGTKMCQKLSETQRNLSGLLSGKPMRAR